MIDDATNTRLSRFFEQETIAGVMEVFSCWIRSYGIPVTIRMYLDGNPTVLWKETKLLFKELTNIQNHKIQNAA
jgi:hypothetical protein